MKKFLTVTLASALLLAGLLSCSGGSQEKQVDLSAFAKSLQEKYEFASYLTEMTPEYPYYEQDMANNLPGLLDMDLEQMVIYMTMITLNNGEFSMVQAKSPQDAAKAAEIFTGPHRLYGGRRGKPRRGVLSRPHRAVAQQRQGGDPGELCVDGGRRGVRADRGGLQRAVLTSANENKGVSEE